jgi:hypothetical protein
LSKCPKFPFFKPDPGAKTVLESKHLKKGMISYKEPVRVVFIKATIIITLLLAKRVKKPGSVKCAGTWR